MSTATLTLENLAASRQEKPSLASSFRAHRHRLQDAFLLLVLSCFVASLLGYHPYAEDGGIYASAVAARADPALYPQGHVWVQAHTGYGQFVPLAALLVRATGASVEAVLFALHLCGIFALLAAALHLARTCAGRTTAAWWAVATLAVGAGLPVAGSSLYGVDPYCCARSLASPLLLLAWSLQLRGRLRWSVLLVALAAIVHPLMALWGCVPLVFTWALHLRRRRLVIPAVALAALAAGALLFALSPADTPLLHDLAVLRSYWFLSQWHWYEWLGAVAPAILLLILAHGAQRPLPFRVIAASAAFTTALALLLALLFARLHAHTSAVARLQPLRALHLVFLVFLVALGARCAAVLHTRARQACGALVLIAATLCLGATQRSLYPATRHLELPGTRSGNDWEEAFLWIRQHTDTAALFALDADYISAAGNDAHGFRAAARRSALPDRAKDGGIAAVMPKLAASWSEGVHTTERLGSFTDAERRRRLLPLGVRWIVLAEPANTSQPCPFHNNSVAVCRLR